MDRHSSEPILDLAHLGHIELLTPDLDGSERFFKTMLGMQETARRGRSIYLRCFEESYHHSLKLTESTQAGLGHVAWRARSAAALERRVQAIEATGFGRGWSAGDLGHGWEIFHEVEYFKAPSAERSIMLNRPQKRPLAAIAARRLDHFNLTVPGIAQETKSFLMETLGFAEREAVVPDDNPEVSIASWLSVTNLSHDLAILPDGPGVTTGRLHHTCFYGGTNESLFDFADLCRDHGYVVEHGPGRHSIGKTSFIYVREPGGNRIELLGDPGALVFDPTHATVKWPASQLPLAAVWTGSPLPPEFFSYATPDEALTLLDATVG
jgi:catechol 2,3-dioxygenase